MCMGVFFRITLLLGRFLLRVMLRGLRLFRFLGASVDGSFSFLFRLSLLL